MDVFADFSPGPDGTVSVAQKPLSGYPAADPMGLFELMTPASGTGPFFRYPVTALEFPDGGHYVGSFATSYTSWTDAALDLQSNGLIPGGTLPATLAGAADSHAKLLALLRGLSPR